LLLAEIFSKVNEQLQQQREGRLFAVVHICGKQFKVTTEDIIIIEGHWAPQIGDKLKLEKVGESSLHLK
jgi:large subunit ribosomal protein L21